MALPRFFIGKDCVRDGGMFRLSGEAAKHMRVLRGEFGETVTVCDGDGTDYACMLNRLSAAEAILNVVSSAKNEAEPNIRVTLFQSLPKADKLDLIIQKCVELGACAFVPFESSRSISQINDKSVAKAIRLQKIARSAAEQSGRGIIPVVHAPLRFEAALENAAATQDLCLAAYEKEIRPARSALLGFSGQKLGIFIGPEGGFSEREAQMFKERGIQTFSLGRRILRAETAGFAAITMLLTILGEY